MDLQRRLWLAMCPMMAPELPGDLRGRAQTLYDELHTRLQLLSEKKKEMLAELSGRPHITADDLGGLDPARPMYSVCVRICGLWLEARQRLPPMLPGTPFVREDGLVPAVRVR